MAGVSSMLAARSSAFLLDERVALDLGTLYTRCGLCGDPAPRRVLPFRPRAPYDAKGSRRHGAQSELTPSAGSDAAVLDQLIAHFRDIFLRVLLMDPKGKRVVVADNVTTPLPLKQAVAQCLFTEFQVHSVTFLPAPLLALFTEGASAGVTVLVPNKQIGVNDNNFQERPPVAAPLLLTGLVIDVGYLNAVVTPVFDGRPLFSAARSAPVAGASVNARLRALLLEQAEVVAPDGRTSRLSALGAAAEGWLTLETLEEIKCAVVTAEQKPDLPAVEVPFAEGQRLRLPAAVQTGAVAHLFDGDEDDRSVPATVLESLLTCSPDVRAAVAQRTLVVGGCAVMPGFDGRLKQALVALTASSARYAPLKELAAALTITASPYARGACVWTGASLAGVLRTRGFEVTAEAFQKTGQIPDWSAMQRGDFVVEPTDPEVW